MVIQNIYYIHRNNHIQNKYSLKPLHIINPMHEYLRKCDQVARVMEI